MDGRHFGDTDSYSYSCSCSCSNRFRLRARARARAGVAALFALLLCVATALAAPASTSALALLPGQVTLTASRSAVPDLEGQRLLVERVIDGRFSGDVSAGAVFRSSDPRVVVVSRDGILRPVAAGRATVTATVGGVTASAAVQVRATSAGHAASGAVPKQAERAIPWFGRGSPARFSGVQPAVNAGSASAASARGPRQAGHAASGAAPSFRNAVEPVLTKMGCNSGACHGAAAGKGGLKLTLRGYDPEADHAVLTRQVGGRRVSRVEPARSLMLLKPTATISHGGGQRFPLDSPEYRVLSTWIAAGAPAPRADDPKMVRLEVFPAAATLKPGDAQQILVRAWFSDGHAEDVTRWVKFGTSDSGVATVDDNGRVSLQGPGEAAITVWYLSQVTFARVISPFPGSGVQADFTGIDRVPARGWDRIGTEQTGTDRHRYPVHPGNPVHPVNAGAGPEHLKTRTPEHLSFIDSLVQKKLQELNIPASGPCSDEEFIRRAYLDAAGILPSAAEVEAFRRSGGIHRDEQDGNSEAPGVDQIRYPVHPGHPVDPVDAGAGPDRLNTRTPEDLNTRRSQLIDALLERPEFVDYWSYKWSDLLLVSSRELSNRSVRAFYNWIRQSVAQNTPWDRFAREIVTASGSTQENGAANYFVLHKDPIDLTETTTQAFLGMSLTCARCHNHPLEKWTQNQYYAMANLFARVSRKNGDAGDVVVFAADTGDIHHPRSGRVLPPQPLDGRPLPLNAPGDRRQYLAAWLTSSQNPDFARAVVNRVWRQFMGRGLVEPEDDLRLTNPASNEELLAALTAAFVRHGFDVKWLIRTIMNSDTYQRSSAPVAGNEADQKYYSHYIVRRLPAEVVLDALSQVTGVPTAFSGYPKGWRALQLPDSQVDSYFLTAFGRPERAITCSCERQQEPSVAQALHLANGDTVNQKLEAADGIIARLVEQQVPDEEVLRRLYLSALSRLPTESERRAILPALAAAPPGSTAAAKATRRQALEDLFWAVLTGREFLFNH